MNKNDILRVKAIKLTFSERIKQDKKWGLQRHSREKWLTILMEEVGELAKEALEKNDANYMEELIQVAAVSIAMLEHEIEKVEK